MEIAMNAEFKILKDQGNGVYAPLGKEDAIGMTIGAFSFVVDGKAIPFDWDACSGSEKDKVFQFEMGSGPFFNEYELANYYDDELAEMGLKREDLTAEYLASASFIEEFHVNFDDQEGHEVSLGWHEDNAGTPDLKVKLLSVGFEDMESGRIHFVKPEVLENYNKGLSKDLVLGKGQIEVTEKDMKDMGIRADGRLKAAAREDMADLASQIRFADELKGQKSDAAKGREDVSLERE